MLSQQTALQFAHNIQQHAPFINSVQLMTIDGLPLHTNVDRKHEDTVSALSAMLYSAASQLANYLDAETTQGMIVCMGESAYAVARIDDDCVMGFQMPADMGTQASLQAICNYISTHQRHLQIVH